MKSLRSIVIGGAVYSSNFGASARTLLAAISIASTGKWERSYRDDPHDIRCPRGHGGRRARLPRQPEKNCRKELGRRKSNARCAPSLVRLLVCPRIPLKPGHPQAARAPTYDSARYIDVR